MAVRLTNRERQVCNAVFLGHGYRFIAAQLRLSEGTLKRHICNILNKTGMSDRLELFKYLIVHSPVLGENPPLTGKDAWLSGQDYLDTLSEMPL